MPLHEMTKCGGKSSSSNFRSNGASSFVHDCIVRVSLIAFFICSIVIMMAMRRHNVAVVVIFAAVALSSSRLVVEAQNFFVNSTTLSGYTADTTAPIAYRCAFLNEWDQNMQPIDYPVGKKFDAAHWGPPLVVTHNANYELWCSGCNASSGFSNYAVVRDNTSDGK